MGIALIVFVFLIEILLSPLRKNVAASEAQQDQLMAELEEAKKKYGANVLKFKEEKKRIIKKYRKIINLRGFDFLIEGIYFVTFWWIFTKGLPQQNWNLLYSWVPHPPEPVNLTFLNLFDLTVVSPMLNLISAVGLFIVLFLKNWWKTKKANREDYLILIWGPFAAYFISTQLPAGQEFFFTITESIYLFRLITKKIKQIGQKLGLGVIPETGKDFTNTAWKQISGS